MPKHNIADLHNHLNGSFSLKFLKETAIRNNCLTVFHDLVKAKKEYLRHTKLQHANGYSIEEIELVWQQFDLIHQIIRNLTDISAGVVDVVKGSEARYLEIRTTPKPMDNKTQDQYIDAFELGLLNANSQKRHKKKATGLLSLDRTVHTLEDAKQFIHRVMISREKLLAGIDICGNPAKERTLTGASLAEVIHLALNNAVPIAIHMGEIDNLVEKQDVDFILAAIADWKITQPSQEPNPLFGKVRLGHCIFLTDPQKEKIAELAIPIEVCPSCHNRLNWHIQSKPHPVTYIYKDLSVDPIVVGTDDKTIFTRGALTESRIMQTFFDNSKNLDSHDLEEQQIQYRFS